jgi:acetyl esterase
MTAELVQTASGIVRGMNEGGVWTFKGIPYGADTSGDGRFRRALPPQPWRTVRECLDYGPSCPQITHEQMLGIPFAPEAETRFGVLGYERVTSEDCLVLNVWSPSLDETARLPVLVWLHGGGWCMGSPDSCDPACRTLAKAAACVVVSVDYRLAPERKFPVPFEDAYTAVRWIAQHAGDVGGDGARLAVGGDSAGATLAAAVALHAREHGPKLRLQVLIYPCTEYPGGDRPSFARYLGGGPVIWSEDVTWTWDVYLRDERDRLDPRAVPASAESLAGAAPAVVVTAEADPVHDEGEAYAERLAAGGVAVTYLPVPGVPHGFFNLPGTIAKATQAHDDVAVALRTAFTE